MPDVEWRGADGGPRWPGLDEAATRARRDPLCAGGTGPIASRLRSIAGRMPSRSAAAAARRFPAGAAALDSTPRAAPAHAGGIRRSIGAPPRSVLVLVEQSLPRRAAPIARRRPEALDRWPPRPASRRSGGTSTGRATSSPRRPSAPCWPRCDLPGADSSARRGRASRMLAPSADRRRAAACASRRRADEPADRDAARRIDASPGRARRRTPWKAADDRGRSLRRRDDRGDDRRRRRGDRHLARDAAAAAARPPSRSRDDAPDDRLPPLTVAPRALLSVRGAWRRSARFGLARTALRAAPRRRPGHRRFHHACRDSAPRRRARAAPIVGDQSAARAVRRRPRARQPLSSVRPAVSRSDLSRSRCAGR